MLRRATERVLGRSAWPSLFVNRSRLSATARALPEPDRVGAFSMLRINQLMTATRSGEVQSPSMKDSAKPMSPDRTHFLKNASRRTRILRRACNAERENVRAGAELKAVAFR